MITSEQTPVGLKFDWFDWWWVNNTEFSPPDTTLKCIMLRTNPDVYHQTEQAFGRGWLHMIDSVISLPTWVWHIYTEHKTYIHDDEVGY